MNEFKEEFKEEFIDQVLAGLQGTVAETISREEVAQFYEGYYFCVEEAVRVIKELTEHFLQKGPLRGRNVH